MSDIQLKKMIFGYRRKVKMELK